MLESEKKALIDENNRLEERYNQDCASYQQDIAEITYAYQSVENKNVSKYVF